MSAELFAPFELAFFRHGFLVAVVAGALCGLIGTYVVLRGMSYIGHGLSHAIFGGAAASAVAGISFFVGAGLWGLVSALIIGGVSRRGVVRSDAAIGVVTTSGFAVGLAIFSLYGHARQNLDALLFGSILGVSMTDVWVVTAVAAVSALVVALAYRPLLFVTFDAEVAEISGIRTAWTDALLMLLLASTILVTMQILGVTLVAAGLVIPPATARLLTDSFARMLGLSAILGAASAAVGMLASYHYDVPPGAAIVLIGTLVFSLAYGVRRLRTAP